MADDTIRATITIRSPLVTEFVAGLALPHLIMTIIRQGVIRQGVRSMLMQGLAVQSMLEVEPCTESDDSNQIP